MKVMWLLNIFLLISASFSHEIKVNEKCAEEDQQPCTCQTNDEPIQSIQVSFDRFCVENKDTNGLISAVQVKLEQKCEATSSEKCVCSTSDSKIKEGNYVNCNVGETCKSDNTSVSETKCDAAPNDNQNPEENDNIKTAPKEDNIEEPTPKVELHKICNPNKDSLTCQENLDCVESPNEEDENHYCVEAIVIDENLQKEVKCPEINFIAVQVQDNPKEIKTQECNSGEECKLLNGDITCSGGGERKILLV